MTTQTTHLNRIARALAVIAAALLGTAAFGATSLRAATAPYHYPVKPFAAEHPVRGNFGDPRTLFSEPPTAAGALYGRGSFQFHFGVDVSAPDGTPVYPVVSGTVTRVNSEWVEVTYDDGASFEYWHIRPVVRIGATVTAYTTVLGRIIAGAHHVHLSEVEDGRYVNPLRPSHLTPYSDRVAPRVASISVHQTASTLALPNLVHGSVEFVVEAYDTPNVPVPGIWSGMPVSPALITWSVRDMRARVVIATSTAVDFRRTIPDSSLFWQVYERGSYQNMCVFGKHYSYRQPGRFLFRLTRSSFDTRRLHDGVYDLVVTVSDIRGNQSTSSLRFTVANRAADA